MKRWILALIVGLVIIGCGHRHSGRVLAPETPMVYTISIADSTCGALEDSLSTGLTFSSEDEFEFLGAEFSARTHNGRHVLKPVDEFEFELVSTGPDSSRVYTLEIQYEHKVPCSLLDKEIVVGYDRN